ERFVSGYVASGYQLPGRFAARPAGAAPAGVITTFGVPAGADVDSTCSGPTVPEADIRLPLTWLLLFSQTIAELPSSSVAASGQAASADRSGKIVLTGPSRPLRDLVRTCTR